MEKLINNIAFTDQDKADYKRKGVFPVRKIFPPDVIQRLLQSVENNFKPDDHPEGILGGFNRFSNEFANRDELFKVLLEQLLEPLNELCGEELGCTQIAVLELEAGKRKGFSWHFDNFSFCYIDPDASGHTFWLPLQPIDVAKQHGGMFWVHQDDFSGKARMQQWAYYQHVDKEHKMPNGKYAEAFHAQYPLDWVGAFDNLMMEDLKQECSFEPGDALLFSRYTWHRSQDLLANGPIQKRTAIIFRLVDLDGKINRTLFQKTMERSELEGSMNPKSFGHRLDGFKDGDLMRDVIVSGVSY